MGHKQPMGGNRAMSASHSIALPNFGAAVRARRVGDLSINNLHRDKPGDDTDIPPRPDLIRWPAMTSGWAYSAGVFGFARTNVALRLSQS